MFCRDWPSVTGRLGLVFLTLALGFSSPAAPVSTRKSTAKRATKASSHAPVSTQGLSSEAAVARWMASLTLREKIAQLVAIPFSGHPFRPRSREAGKFMNLVTREHVGSLSSRRSCPTPSSRYEATADALIRELPGGASNPLHL